MLVKNNSTMKVLEQRMFPRAGQALHPGHPLPMRNCSARCYSFGYTLTHTFNQQIFTRNSPGDYVLSSVQCRREAAGDSGSSLKTPPV